MKHDLVKVLTRIGMKVSYEIGANLYGTVQHPYLTWKRILREGHWWSSVVLLLIISVYFGIREPIRWGNISWQGIVIHRISVESITWWATSSGLRLSAALGSYVLIVLMISWLSKLVNRQSRWESTFKRVFKVWIYSYLPTVLWFLMAAGLFIVLPPPRHASLLGWLFSVIFLTISCGLLIWKGLLYFLTLKLATGLSNKQIFWVTLMVIPLVMVYSQIMYGLNIFRVPFI